MSSRRKPQPWHSAPEGTSCLPGDTSCRKATCLPPFALRNIGGRGPSVHCPAGAAPSSSASAAPFWAGSMQTMLHSAPLVTGSCWSLPLSRCRRLHFQSHLQNFPSGRGGLCGPHSMQGGCPSPPRRAPVPILGKGPAFPSRLAKPSWGRWGGGGGWVPGG